MITKESITIKKCCLYVSDYHLEMILLPYIKQKMNKVNFVIITENNLEESIKVLLDRINLKEEDKNQIINLNWEKGIKEKIDYIKETKSLKRIEVIVKGKNSFINKVNNELFLLKKDINILNCFDISDRSLDIEKIKKEYNEFINTKRL